MQATKIEEHIKRHKKMMRYQKKIAPFTPTIDELLIVWKLNTKSHVIYCLNNLIKLGLIITRKHGIKTYYYAVEKKG